MDWDKVSIKPEPQWSVGINLPKYKWRCQLHPGTYWYVEDRQVPNWFHRKMQQLCFGIVWEKIDG